MGYWSKYAKVNSEELQMIRKYFRDCLPTINDNNLFMLRKACMYMSLIYIFMEFFVRFVLYEFRFSLPYFLVIPLMLVYFNINLYTLKHRGKISTGKTAAICCTFYFFLGVILGLVDVYEAPAGQALWLPLAVIALPMIFIDHMYKYGFEEAVVLIIMLTQSYFHKSPENFKKDLYISIAAYVISMFSARIILEMRAREALAAEEVTRLSALDKLTHVLNKNALLERIDNYFSRKAPEEACAMCIIDLDDFKLVNDNLGHNTGDLLLEKMGQLLIENFRAYDLVGRYGGDEFVVMMPRMGDETILQARCKALQMYINDLDVGGGHKITASIGAIICSGDVTRQMAFDMADDALYKSKILGKNCCTTWVYDTESIERDILLVMTANKDEGVEDLFRGEGDRFEILHVSNDDEALCNVSRYHDKIKIILMEVDVDTGLGVFLLKYLKKREGFSDIPLLAVVNTKKAYAMAEELQATEVISSDEPDEKFNKTITRLINARR